VLIDGCRFPPKNLEGEKPQERSSHQLVETSAAMHLIISNDNRQTTMLYQATIGGQKFAFTKIEG
jgi:hypothetical protein